MGLMMLGRQKYTQQNHSGVELAIEKLKSYKSPGVDQNPAELIRAGGRTIRYEIHKLIIRRNRLTTDHT